MTPFLMLTYTIKPAAMHRFVGYLEETAVHTYSNILHHCETPGTHLHNDWAALPAPDIAISYWSLQPEATWVDTLKRMLADEAHHRDVNHTFADLGVGTSAAQASLDNPFIHEHVDDFNSAVNRRAERTLKAPLVQMQQGGDMWSDTRTQPGATVQATAPLAPRH